jgi:hypothetical protein
MEGAYHSQEAYRMEALAFHRDSTCPLVAFPEAFRTAGNLASEDTLACHMGCFPWD